MDQVSLVEVLIAGQWKSGPFPSDESEIFSLVPSGLRERIQTDQHGGFVKQAPGRCVQEIVLLDCLRLNRPTLVSRRRQNSPELLDSESSKSNLAARRDAGS